MADRKQSKLFREKTLTRVSSPENLDVYIKSTTPALWLVLISIILFLVGVILWATFGKVDSISEAGFKTESGYLITYVNETNQARLCDESSVEVGGKTYQIDSITGPYIVDHKTDSFLASANGLNSGDWYYIISCKSDLEGERKGKIIYEKISPISFIMN